MISWLFVEKDVSILREFRKSDSFPAVVGPFPARVRLYIGSVSGAVKTSQKVRDLLLQ
jgi:hypothetical protein